MLIFGDTYIIMPRHVIDDTYLGNWSICMEHPALYDTSLKEYKNSFRDGNI